MNLYIQPQDIEAMTPILNSMPDEGNLLEIGTGKGHSTKWFAEMKPKWMIYTVDAFGLYGDGRVYEKFTQEQVLEVQEYYKGHNVIQILADSTKLPWNIPIDILYIDGGHYYDTVKSDYDKFSPFVKAGGYIFFHDYWREDFGVRQVVQESGLPIIYEGKMAICKK